MVKLKDIAEACGVSTATVSRALNGVTDPANKTAVYITQVARELGYYPNAAARTLKTSRSNNIGILYEDRMDHEYFSLLLNELRFGAEDHGYDLTFIRRSAHVSEEGTYYDRAKRRSLDGVVVVQTDFHAADVMRLVAGNIPTVVIDHAYEGCDCVMSDNYHNMGRLVRAAWELGHRRIAYISGEDSAVTRERVAGFYKQSAEIGLRVPSDYVQEGRFHDPADCTRAVRALMKLEEPPTCILCPDDFSCLGTLAELEKAGLHIPGDLSLAGYDGIRMGQMMQPRLTTIRQDASEVAHQAIALLLDAIEHPETHAPRHVTVPGVLLPGDTLGPAPSEQR